MSITIIGAGISSLILSRCLLARSAATSNSLPPLLLLEKSTQAAFRKRNNYAITLHRKTYRPLLEILGVEEEGFVGRVGVFGDGEGDGGRGDGEDGELRVNRRLFENFLLEGVDVQFEREVVDISTSTSKDDDAKEGANGVVVKLSTGEEIKSQVVVGGDGVHSIVRKTYVSPETEFVILPFVVLNGKRRLSLKEFEEMGFDSWGVVEQRVGDALFTVSVIERREEDFGVNYTYSRAVRGEGDEGFRPGREVAAAGEIPEQVFGEVDSLRGGLEGGLRGVFETGRMKGDRLLSWLMRVVEVEEGRLVEAAEKGVVLMGDAVHAEPIVGGEGANVAIEDGMKLAELLADGGTAQLSRFYKDRQDGWARSVKESKARISAMHGVTKPSL
ncbi:hypothetical protein M409DRAFT_21763 [Zasmidium cellare ATCC 36951]|uniref:FAD-binding domain-containing protein n=1 Tax=Zasmidium cellare ATCC 36951 TaxID=1080233 RepID=A0A6A6CS72_ZASCE|nr:uncharacterized protein M409DRAFT_21763 [Zasmidium cellare ATCC 36951]KAF2168326.1 hypothetical protein M409DRAFT_21763 [Zasmidium cellare ATCC 36951]